MGLRIKIFDIWGIHWKIGHLGGGGGFLKNEYKEGIAKKEELRQFVDLRGAWQETEGWCFWGDWYPDAHYVGRQNNNNNPQFKGGQI